MKDQKPFIIGLGLSVPDHCWDCVEQAQAIQGGNGSINIQAPASRRQTRTQAGDAQQTCRSRTS